MNGDLFEPVDSDRCLNHCRKTRLRLKGVDTTGWSDGAGHGDGHGAIVRPNVQGRVVDPQHAPQHPINFVVLSSE